MPNGEEIQSKYNFTDKQIENLSKAHQEMLKFDDTPQELGAFVSMLNKDEENIKKLHNYFQKFNDTPDDVGEFKSMLGFDKKKRDESQPSREEIKPDVSQPSREAIEPEISEEEQPEEQLANTFNELSNKYNNIRIEFEEKQSELSDLEQEIGVDQPSMIGTRAPQVDIQSEDVSQEKLDKRDRMREDLNYKKTLLNQSKTLLYKGKELIEVSQKPEGAKTFGEGVVSGLQNYFKEYADIVNKIGGKDEIDNLREKVKKHNQGEDIEFTETEKLFLNVTQKHMDAVGELRDKIPFSAEIGESIGQSLAFMGEFVLTGGAVKGVGVGLKGFAGKAAKKAAQAGLQTLVMPSFIKESAKNLNQDEKDDVEAVWDAYVDNVIEVGSERLFMGKLPQVGTSNVVSRVLNRMGSAMAGRKGVKGVTKAFGEEMLEEEIAMLAHSIKREDSVSDVVENITNIDEQLKTASAVGIMTGAFGGAQALPKVKNMADNGLAQFKLRKAGEKLDKETKDYLDSVLEDENITVEEAREDVKRVAQDYASDENLSSDQAKQKLFDVMNYATRKMRNLSYQSKVEAQETEQQPEEETVGKPSEQVQVEQTETQTPSYRIGGQVFDSKQEFLDEVKRYKGVENVPRIRVENDTETGNEVSRILQEGLEEQQEIPEVESTEIQVESSEEAGRVKDQYDELKNELRSLEEGKDPRDIGRRFAQVGNKLPKGVRDRFTQQLKQKQQQFQQQQEELRQEREREITGETIEPQQYEIEEQQTEQGQRKKTLQQKATQTYNEIIEQFDIETNQTREQKVRQSRDKLRQYIRDNRKELKKISGRAVPTMLNRVNDIKSEKSFAKAVNDINRYIADSKFRERLENHQKNIEKIKSEISEKKITTKTQAGRQKAKKKGEVFAGYIDRARRIRSLIPGTTGIEKIKNTEKYDNAFEAERMYNEGAELTEVADKLNMTQKSKESSNLEEKIINKIEGVKREYEKLTNTQGQALESGENVMQAVEDVEVELEASDPNMKKIKNRLASVGERVEKSPEDMNVNDVEARLQVLKQDLEFYNLEDKSPEQVERLVKQFDEIKKKTIEDVKADIEERNKKYEERINEVLSRVDPEGKSVLSTKEQAKLKQIEDNLTAHLGVRNFWAVLDRIDMKSESPMRGELVNSFVDVMRRGDIQHEQILSDFYDDLQSLQEGVFGKEGLYKTIRELSVAPGRPKEKLIDKIQRVNGNVRRVVTEEVEVKNDKGEIIDYLPLNQMVAAKKWLELQDPSLEETFFTPEDPTKGTGMGYTKHHVRTIENYLRDDVKEYASRIMNDLFPKYYERFNETYRKINGVDLPRNEFYTPIYRMAEERTIDTDVLADGQGKFGTINNGHTIMRQANKRQLEYVDLNQTLNSYMRKMAHYTAYAEPVKEVSKVFRYSRRVRKAVRQLHGKRVLRDIDRFIEDFSENNRYQEFKIIDKLRKNYIFASLALKGNQVIKQFASIGAGLDYLGFKEFNQAFSDFAKNPSQKIDFIMSNSLIKRRLEQGNFDPDAAISLAQDWTRSGKKSNWKNKMMLPTKYGDLAPIAVLYPKYYEKALREAKEQGYEGDQARERAENKATHEILTWQQSTFMSDLSSVQRTKGLQRMLVMYATAPLSYHRKAVSGARHFVRGIRNNDRKAIAQGAKATFIGWVLMPQLYQFFLNGFRFDKDDQMRALVLGNLNALPFTGEVLNWGANQIMDRPFDFQITPLSSLIRYGKEAGITTQELLKKMEEEEEKMTVDDLFSIIEAVGQTAAFTTGLPWGQYDHLEGARFAAQGYANDWWESFRRAAGWSEWQITPNKAILNDKQREVMRSIMTDETIGEMVGRIREKYGVKHLADNMGEYIKIYQMRKMFDPTYTSELITDLQQARDNDKKKNILLKEGSSMSRDQFVSMVGKMMQPISVPMLGTDGELKQTERTTLISEELGEEVIREYLKEQEE